METGNRNLNSLIGHSNKIMKLISLCVLSIFLMGSPSDVSANIVWSVDFDNVSLEDMDLTGWDFTNKPTVEIEHGFTFVGGALKAPPSSSLFNRSVMNRPSSITNGTWSFDLIINNIDDTHYAVDYMWTDLTGTYDFTGLDGFNSRPWSGYSLSILSYEFDGAIIDGPGLSAIAYDDSLIRGFETIKFHSMPREKLVGTHHFDITRDIDGHTSVYFDYELQFNFTDTRTTNAEKFSIQSWMGGASIDNILVSDTVDEIIKPISDSDLTQVTSSPTTSQSIIDDNGLDTNTENEVFENLELPFQGRYMLGLIIPVITLATIGYYKIYIPRLKKGIKLISKTIGQEISPIFQDHPSLFYLLLSQKNNKPTPDEEELGRAIPRDIFDHKFLMHPVRLAMAKLLFETVDLTSVELRNALDLSWGDYSTHITALKKQEYVYIRDEFRNGLMRQVISITDLVYRQFSELLSLLQEFVSNSPQNYLNSIDNYYSSELKDFYDETEG